MTTPVKSVVNHVNYAFNSFRSSRYFIPGTVVAVTLVAGVALKKVSNSIYFSFRFLFIFYSNIKM